MILTVIKDMPLCPLQCREGMRLSESPIHFEHGVCVLIELFLSRVSSRIFSLVGGGGGGGGALNCS